jgi:uncharacterized protein (TIGR02172 family)
MFCIVSEPMGKCTDAPICGDSEGMEISMKGQLIGEGNTAEVYAWGDKEILKLFRKEFPYEGIEKEYQISKVIGNQGLPVPKALNFIELEDRRGIIYERAIGASFTELIMRNPLRCAKYAEQLADIHYQIHQCFGLEIPKYKENLEWSIRHTDQLSEGQKLAILDLLEQLPEGDALCHGDFHPGNIMGVEGNYYILDWMTASAGTPAADVARTMLLLKDATLPEHMPIIIKFVVGRMRKSLADAYIKQYVRLSGLQKEEVESWRIVIAAARLIEWVPKSEKNALLREIKELLKGSKIGRR